MQTLQLDARATLLSSASHNGETVGNQAQFRREKYVQADGTVENVPVISGNGVRGLLRDAAAAYLLDTLDFTGLGLDRFYLLFSGGALTKAANKALDLDGLRSLRETVPPIAVFGGANGNHISPGKIDVGKLVPLARETAHLLRVDPAGLQSVYDLMQTESYTRFDDAKNHNLALYHHEDAAADAPAQQMRYDIETMAAGTVLHWHITLRGLSEIETLCLVSALKRWSLRPVVGGKGGTGHGTVAVAFSNGWRVAAGETELPDLTPYDEYLHANRAAIQQALYG